MASGRAPVSAGSIAELVERKVARSKRNVFLRGDFVGLGSYDAVGRALRQMIQSGRLVQIGYGLYAKAERSPFSGKATPLVGILALGLRMIGRAAHMLHAAIIEPFGQIAGYVAGAVVTEQPGFVLDMGLVAA